MVVQGISVMFVIWRWCGAIFLIITFILSSAPTLTQGQKRWGMCVNQSQVEGVLRRFQMSGGLSHESKLRQILDCVKLENSACPDDLRLSVTSEILLRDRTREMGEDCTSGGGKYSKPFYKNIYQSGQDYNQFKEELLATGLIFCNPFKHLYCSPQNKCECRPGTVLKPEVNPEVCTLIVGGYCLPFDKYSIFDPFNLGTIDRSNTMDIPDLECKEGDRKQCRFPSQYFYDDICANDVIVELDKNLTNHFKFMPRLSFGDPCNFEHHEVLLKSPEEEWKDYTIRVKKLEEIMRAKTQFCDIQRLLVCGNISRKCECIKQTVYDPNKKNCSYERRPVDLCEQFKAVQDFAKSLTYNASRDLKEFYDITKERECKGFCIFDLNSRTLHCSICSGSTHPFNIGRNCDKIITSFLTRRHSLPLASDEDDYGKQLDLLDELSDKATEFEKILRLDEGSTCDLQGELDRINAVMRIRNLDAEDPTVATKEYYRGIIDFTDTVTRNYGARGLCQYNPNRTLIKPGLFPDVSLNFRPEFVCVPTATKPTCYRLKNHEEYLEILRKRLLPFKTLSEGQRCTFNPEEDIDNKRRFGFGRDDSSYSSLFVKFENHFVKKTQFCSTTSGLQCKFPSPYYTEIGKCEFSDGRKTEMKKDSGDLSANAPHFIHVTFLVILFTCLY